MTRVAVVHHTLGPYHIARAWALERIEGHAACWIQLASEEKLHGWVTREAWVETIATGALEDADPKALAAGLVARLEAIRPRTLAVAGYAHPAMRAAARWARRRGVPCILMSDSQRCDRRRWWPLERAKALWIRHHYPAAFVAGERAAAYLRGLGVAPERIWKGYDVVDNAFFATHAREARWRAQAALLRHGVEGPFFIYVGRLAPEKNLASLLRAHGAYKTQRETPWDLVLVGDGPLGRRLRALGKPGTHFLGSLEPGDLAGLYGAAGALVLPSLSEPWGLVVNEAMAAGLPAIVSERCGCVPELVRPGQSGWVFDPLREDELVDAMLRMSGPETDRAALGDTARTLVAPLSPETWARALCDCVGRVGEGAV